MMQNLHFTLKISADIFGSLEIKLLAQPSFENLQEFGLCLKNLAAVDFLFLKRKQGVGG
jgi:hypothetical protein